MSVIDDTTLLRMAEAEIIGEAKRAAIRHSIAGVSGWQPCPKPNKMFLTNMLLQTMTSNNHLSRKRKKNHKIKKPERKLLQSKSKTDLTTNFIYQKPKNGKKKSVYSKNSSNFKNNIKPVDIHSNGENGCKEKVNINKINLKKV